MRKPLTAAVAATALLLTGCSSDDSEDGGMLNSTESVCDDFARFIRDGRPADQRSEVVSSIGEVIGNADQKLQDNYETLTNTVNGSAGAQELADDVFAQTCFDVGWDG